MCLFQDLRRNQRRLADLNSTIRKLEDRNSLLVDERSELVGENELVKDGSSAFSCVSNNLFLCPFAPPTS